MCRRPVWDLAPGVEWSVALSQCHSVAFTRRGHISSCDARGHRCRQSAHKKKKSVLFLNRALGNYPNDCSVRKPCLHPFINLGSRREQSPALSGEGNLLFQRRKDQKKNNSAESSLLLSCPCSQPRLTSHKKDAQKESV